MGAYDQGPSQVGLAGWEHPGRQAQASHPRPRVCSAARRGSSPKAKPIMEVLPKAPESSTQTLPTSAAS